VVDQILAKRKTKQIIQQHLADKQRVFLTLLAKSKRAHEHDRIPPAKSKALHEIDALFQRLLADKSSFGDVHVLSDVRSFLARDAALLLRDNGGPPRTAAWEKSTLAAAIARYDEASEAKAWESGGVYSSVSVLKQSKVDGVAGMHAAAVLHLGGTPATNALGQKFRTSLYGSASPSPVSSPPFTPWWDSAKCAALTASPPPEILALRALHAKTSSFKSKSGRIVAPMLERMHTLYCCPVRGTGRTSHRKRLHRKRSPRCPAQRWDECCCSPLDRAGSRAAPSGRRAHHQQKRGTRCPTSLAAALFCQRTSHLEVAV